MLCKYVFDVCKVKFVMGRNLQLWSLLRPVKRTACRASFHGVLVFFSLTVSEFCKCGSKAIIITLDFGTLRVSGPKPRNAIIYHARSVVQVCDVCKVTLVMGRNLQPWPLLRSVKRTGLIVLWCASSSVQKQQLPGPCRCQYPEGMTASKIQNT